jgi:hypothetical protein
VALHGVHVAALLVAPGVRTLVDDLKWKERGVT